MICVTARLDRSPSRLVFYRLALGQRKAAKCQLIKLSSSKRLLSESRCSHLPSELSDGYQQVPAATGVFRTIEVVGSAKTQSQTRFTQFLHRHLSDVNMLKLQISNTSSRVGCQRKRGLISSRGVDDATEFIRWRCHGLEDFSKSIASNLSWLVAQVPLAAVLALSPLQYR